MLINYSEYFDKYSRIVTNIDGRLPNENELDNLQIWDGHYSPHIEIPDNAFIPSKHNTCPAVSHIVNHDEMRNPGKILPELFNEDNYTLSRASVTKEHTTSISLNKPGYYAKSASIFLEHRLDNGFSFFVLKSNFVWQINTHILVWPHKILKEPTKSFVRKTIDALTEKERAVYEEGREKKAVVLNNLYGEKAIKDGHVKVLPYGGILVLPFSKDKLEKLPQVAKLLDTAYYVYDCPIFFHQVAERQRRIKAEAEKKRLAAMALNNNANNIILAKDKDGKTVKIENNKDSRVPKVVIGERLQ